MNTHRLPLLLASLLLAACSNVVIGGSGETSSVGGNTDMGGTGGSGVGGSTSTGPAAPTLPAVALTRAQLDVLWDQYWSTHDPSGSSGSTGGGPALDPNDLFLRVSDQGVSCGSPTTDLPCGGHYALSIGVPSSLQQVGVYDLQSPELSQYSYMEESGTLQSNDPNDCGWGGGSLFDGTLEILSIDATEVHFRVTTTGGIWDTNPSGDYTAPRCP